MTDRPSFYEQFDRSAARRRRVSTSRVLAVTILGVLLVVGLFVAARIVLDDGGKSPEAWLEEGLAAHIEGRLVDAASAYQQVLLADPSNKYAHYNIGLIAHTQGRAEQAEASYRRALETDPNYAPAAFNLAILRADAGDHDEAIDLYRLVVAIEPDNADAHLNLGFSLRSVGDLDEGDVEIARAISLDPSLRERTPDDAVQPAGAE